LSTFHLKVMQMKMLRSSGCTGCAGPSGFALSLRGGAAACCHDKFVHARTASAVTVRMNIAREMSCFDRAWRSLMIRVLPRWRANWCGAVWQWQNESHPLTRSFDHPLSSKEAKLPLNHKIVLL